MVSVKYIVHSALKQDTTMSRAFLKACGVKVAPRRDVQCGAIYELDTAQEIEQEILWAFKNTHSPLDWLGNG